VENTELRRKTERRKPPKAMLRQAQHDKAQETLVIGNRLIVEKQYGHLKKLRYD
jgi:hypothetical protein